MFERLIYGQPPRVISCQYEHVRARACARTQTRSSESRKVWWGGCHCVLTKWVRSARQPSFEGVPGVLPPKIFLKVTLKSMHILRNFTRIFFFIIAFFLIY